MSSVGEVIHPLGTSEACLRLGKLVVVVRELEVHAALTEGLDLAIIEAPAEAEAVEDDDLLF